jgi:bacterioferritin (cytochrome b1)
VPHPEKTSGPSRGEDERWLLSFYRTSEISGSLFFGKLARTLRPGPIQVDMTKHFADEASHAWFWTACICEMGGEPLKLSDAYQDQYVAAAGMPANLMEVLAITQVFERRVINQYTRHARLPDLAAPVARTLERIMKDELWHIEWVKKALESMEAEYGKEEIEKTLERLRAADREVYLKTTQEHEQRLEALFRSS